MKMMLGLDFFNKREKFLLIDIAPKRTSGLLISVDGDKKIRPEKFWEDFSFGKLSCDPFRGLRKQKIIVSAHPAFAATVSVPVCLEREAADLREPINPAELENLFVKAIGMSFGKLRAGAGGRLGLRDLDTVLVGVRAENFKVDGHMVINPVGFGGREIEAALEFVFTTREIFDDLKTFFKLKEGFFFTPHSRASVFALSRGTGSPASAIFLGSGESYYIAAKSGADATRFCATGGDIHSRVAGEEKLNWSLGRLFEAAKAILGTSERVTFEIYRRHLRGDVSPDLTRAISRALKPELDLFFKEIRDKKPKGYIYVFSPVALPFSYPLRLGPAALKEPPFESVVDKFGFALDVRELPAEKGEVFPRLAPFLEFYFDKSDSELNRRLRRRLHWLAQ